MKKHWLLAALAGAALAGCVKNDVLVPQEKNVKIGFASPVLNSNVNTKTKVYGEIGSHIYEGSSVVYSYPREEKFKIFAVEHSGDLISWGDATTTATAFNGQAISYYSSLDAWVPFTDNNGYYYWPDDAKLSFAAMSPAELDVTGATVTYGAKGLVVDNFIVADDPAKQYDLLYSERSINQTSQDVINGAQYYSGIPIVFKHSLASIHFSLKSTATEEVTLQSITLKNSYNKGKFEENITDEAALTRAPKWTTASDSDTKDYQSFKGSVVFPENPQYVSDLAAKDGIDDDVSHPLLLLPQTLSDNVVVEVKYLVGGELKTRNVQLNKYPATNPIKAWEPGTKYTYRLVYSADAQKQDIIYFSPSTQDWTDGGIVEVTL